MAPVMVWPLASLSGAVSQEKTRRAVHRWGRFHRFYDRVEKDEARIEHAVEELIEDVEKRLSRK